MHSRTAMHFFVEPGSNFTEKYRQSCKTKKVEQRADQKVDKSVDNGSASETEDVGKEKDSSLKTDLINQPTEAETEQIKIKTISGTGEQVAFETYSKFDFIPGDKVIAYDDFSQDAIGDFPANWNTNSSGEVVSSSIQAGHWLMVQKQESLFLSISKVFPTILRLNMMLSVMRNSVLFSCAFSFLSNR